MYKLLARGSVLTAALVFSACSQDVTAPAGVAGSGGSGNDTECRNLFLTGVHDNVLVPEGSVCVIFQATINGHVKALPTSQLYIEGNTTVRGNIEGDKADVVDMYSFFGTTRNRVLGSIQIKEGGSTGNFSYARICGTDLPNGNIQIEKTRNYVLVGGPFFCSGIGGGNTLTKGNIKIEENLIGAPFLGGQMEVSRNTVGGNVQVLKNTGPGTKWVQFNTVRESLQCFENMPPFIGGPNTAGKAEGQCF